METKGFAPHTRETKLATLSALFEYFRDYGVINRNPATAYSGGFLEPDNG